MLTEFRLFYPYKVVGCRCRWIHKSTCILLGSIWQQEAKPIYNMYARLGDFYIYPLGRLESPNPTVCQKNLLILLSWAFNEVRLVYIFQLLVLNDKPRLMSWVGGPGWGDGCPWHWETRKTWGTCLAKSVLLKSPLHQCCWAFFTLHVCFGNFNWVYSTQDTVAHQKHGLKQTWLSKRASGRQELERVWTSPYGSRSRRRAVFLSTLPGITPKLCKCWWQVAMYITKLVWYIFIYFTIYNMYIYIMYRSTLLKGRTCHTCKPFAIGTALVFHLLDWFLHVYLLSPRHPTTIKEFSSTSPLGSLMFIAWWDDGSSLSIPYLKCFKTIQLSRLGWIKELALISISLC